MMRSTSCAVHGVNKAARRRKFAERASGRRATCTHTHGLQHSANRSENAERLADAWRWRRSSIMLSSCRSATAAVAA